MIEKIRNNKFKEKNKLILKKVNGRKSQGGRDNMLLLIVEL